MDLFIRNMISRNGGLIDDKIRAEMKKREEAKLIAEGQELPQPEILDAAQLRANAISRGVPISPKDSAEEIQRKLNEHLRENSVGGVNSRTADAIKQMKQTGNDKTQREALVEAVDGDIEGPTAAVVDEAKEGSGSKKAKSK